MTEDEFADKTESHARWSAIVTLTVCSILSLLGGWYYAVVYGAGTFASALTTDTVTVVLILSIHLRGAVRAAYDAERVSRKTYFTSSAGVAALIVMTLAGNYATLHSLAEHMQLHWLTAILAPAATDVGVLASTNALFSLKPRMAQGQKRRTAPRTGTRSAGQSALSPARSTPLLAPSSAEQGAAPIAPKPAPSRAVTSRAVQSSDYADLAHRVVQSGATTKPVQQVAEVLAHRADGLSQDKIADAVGINKRTVRSILAAAEGVADNRQPPIADRQLTAVG